MPQYHGMYLNYRRPKKATQATKLIEQRSPEGPTPNLNRGFRPNYPPAMTGATPSSTAPSPTHFGYKASKQTGAFNFAPSVMRDTIDSPRFPRLGDQSGGIATSIPDLSGDSPPGVVASEEGAKQPFDWNRLAYVLGDIGQATMGRFQDRWQGQLGGGVKKLSQSQAYKKAMARALSGDRLDPDEFTILSPEQRAEINSLQTENEKLKLERMKARHDYKLKLKKQEFDEGRIEEEMRQFDIDMGWAKEEKAIDVSERAKDRAQATTMQATQITSTEDIAEAKNVIARASSDSLDLYRKTTGKDPTDDPALIEVFNSITRAIGVTATENMSAAQVQELMAKYFELLGRQKEADMMRKGISAEPPPGATGVSETINKYTGKRSSGAGGIF